MVSPYLRPILLKLLFALHMNELYTTDHPSLQRFFFFFLLMLILYSFIDDLFLPLPLNIDLYVYYGES